MAPLVLVERRDKFEAYLLALCLLTGVSVLLGLAPVNEVQRSVPHLLHTCWAVFLALGGGIGLLGVLWKPGSLALLIEQAGLCLLAGACFAFTLILLRYSGTAGAVTTATIAVFGWVVVDRILEIRAAFAQYSGGAR